MVYVSTAADMVGVKLSSWPVPQDPVMLSATQRAFDAITRHLAASGAQAGHLPRPGSAVVLNTAGTSPARSAANALRIAGSAPGSSRPSEA